MAPPHAPSFQLNARAPARGDSGIKGRRGRKSYSECACVSLPGRRPVLSASVADLVGDMLFIDAAERPVKAGQGGLVGGAALLGGNDGPPIGADVAACL